MKESPAPKERLALELLTRKQSHYECEDCWYSCPASGACCNEHAGTECNCGADAENAMREAALACIREQQAALVEMEEGYRSRCNFCGGKLAHCEYASTLPGACRAPAARAALTKWRLK